MNASKRMDRYQRMLDYGETMRDHIEEYAENTEHRIVTMDNCDPAMIGLVEIKGQMSVVYDYNLLVSLLMVRDQMTYEEAVEFVDYNMRSRSEGYPVILERDPAIVHLGPAKKNPTVKRRLTSDQLELSV